MAHAEQSIDRKDAPVVDSETSSSASSTPASPVASERRRFDVVLRGYERHSVDQYLAQQDEQLAKMRHDLAESERRRALAEQHATATENEIRTLRSESQFSERTPPEESFGYRAEKLLRLAEQEAADARSAAGREAAAVIEQARADAEQHRHEVEQSLIARSSLLDQQAAQRTVELQEREQQIAAQMTTARSEIDAMHEAARRAAEQHRRQAEGDAEAVRARAAHAAQRMRDQAEQEVARLAALRDDARAEITRLAELLANELGGLSDPQRGIRPSAGQRDAAARIPGQAQSSPAPADQPADSQHGARPANAEPAERAAAARGVGH
jgi:chromosome segregation ATPase